MSAPCAMRCSWRDLWRRLCHQNADGEAQVAMVLRAYCSNRLYRAIQETGVLLALLDGKTDVDPESDEVTSLADPDDHL